MVSRIICLTMLVAVASAATYMERQPKKPQELAHKTGCYIKELNDVIPYGATASPIGVCYRIECSERFLHYASCGTVATSDDATCYITETDLSRPYPDCCPTIQCDLDNNLI